MNLYPIRVFAVLGVLFSLAACQTTTAPVLSSKPALELRAMQTRVFETPDQSKIYRALVEVFLDLGYAITTIEPEAGVIGGNKLAQLDLTATVNKKGPDRTLVRANSLITLASNGRAMQVDAPEFYQKNFFEPLSKAIFLEAMHEELSDEEKVQIKLQEEAKAQQSVSDAKE